MTRHRTSSSEAPLLAWGDAIRANRIAAARRRSALLRHAGSTGLLIALLGTTLVSTPAPRLVWNASASAPLGLYLVRPGKPVVVKGMVVSHLPSPWRDVAAERGYLPAHIPLVKRVAAGPGDSVCAAANHIEINARPVAARLAADARHRSMPWWTGCRTLRAGQYFLLMEDTPNSFDGRYFGITGEKDIVGPARLILPARDLPWRHWR